MSVRHDRNAIRPDGAIRALIHEFILQVAMENSKRLAALTDNLALLESGLDSLCLAVIVARLEDELGVDPFNTTQDLVFPVTIGEFIELYENAAN